MGGWAAGWVDGCVAGWLWDWVSGGCFAVVVSVARETGPGAIAPTALSGNALPMECCQCFSAVRPDLAHSWRKKTMESRAGAKNWGQNAGAKTWGREMGPKAGAESWGPELGTRDGAET